MDAQQNAETIAGKMFERDAFSRWLGLEFLSIGPGRCVLRMKVRGEMLNGFGIAHGGIAYSLADSALAFASNSQGRHALSVETSISHAAPVHEGDLLVATALEAHLSHKIGLYQVDIQNQHGRVIAFFKGTVYRKKQEW